MSRGLNAFQLVAPRVAAAPTVQPPSRGGARGKAPGALKGSGPQHGQQERRVLDINGRPMATLAPRSFGSPQVIGRAQGQAQNDKTRAIVRGGI